MTLTNLHVIFLHQNIKLVCSFAMHQTQLDDYCPKMQYKNEFGLHPAKPSPIQGLLGNASNKFVRQSYCAKSVKFLTGGHVREQI